MRIRCLHVFLVLAVVGCGKPPSPMANANVAPAPQGEVVSAELSRREQVEKVLARNLRDVPVGRRYDAVTQKAYDMWKLFNGFSSNEMEYVILAVARFQRELEAELQGIEMPPKTVDLGPQHVSADAGHYRCARQAAQMGNRMSRPRAVKFPYGVDTEGGDMVEWRHEKQSSVDSRRVLPPAGGRELLC